MSNVPAREPDPTVILAIERTLLAWTRTALALMGFGFVAAQIARSKWIGLGLVVLGGVVQAISLVSHAESIRRIRTGEPMPLKLLSPATVLGASIVLLTIVIALYLAMV